MKTIPRYKRDRYIFISNLSEVTANSAHELTLNREGYLLSENFTDSSKIELARWVRQRRNLLISDNGNFSRMKSIAKKFENEGNQILKHAEQEFETKGTVSQQTLQNRDQIIEKISVACSRELNKQDFNKIIERQVAINPHYLIGLEDFTIPVLMMCGLLHPVFSPAAESVKVFQEQTSSLYEKQCQGQFGHSDKLSKAAKFLVLHAYDYESAFRGAKQLNAAPEGLAISYGSPMRSRRWITELDFGDKRELFSEKLPEPYLVATALTLGAVSGLNSDTPIHILGVGSPILIALIGQLLNQSRAVSIDSTAPFKDSNVGTLYGSRYAFIKMKMYKVAAYALIDNKPFTSRTPYFKQFEHDFPSNWAAMRAELGIHSSSDVNDVVDDLKANAKMVETHIPFFSRMRSGNDPMIERLRMDRAGHNYWILRNICVGVRKRMQQPEKMAHWMGQQVERYKKVGSDKWSKAVSKAFELSQIYKPTR